MFPARYFPGRYFAGRYWPKVGAAVVVVPASGDAPQQTTYVQPSKPTYHATARSVVKLRLVSWGEATFRPEARPKPRPSPSPRPAVPSRPEVRPEVPEPVAPKPAPIQPVEAAAHLRFGLSLQVAAEATFQHREIRASGEASFKRRKLDKATRVAMEDLLLMTSRRKR